MSLTVSDILEKTFKRAFKGYDEDDVDQFLDQIIEEMKALSGRINVLEKELTEAREKSTKVKDTEEAIMHTLVSAQKSSERILNEAARKAELLIDNAQNTAKQRRQDTDAELADAERKLEAIKRSAQKFATSFANMVNAQAASFDQAYQAYFGDIDAFSGGVLSAKALERIDEELAQNLKEIALSETEGHLPAEPEAPPVKKELEPPRFVIDETQKPDPVAFEKPEDSDEDIAKALEREAKAALESGDAEPEVQPQADAPAEEGDNLQAAANEEGWLSLHEINQVLTRMEQEGGDILQDSYDDAAPSIAQMAQQAAPETQTEPEETAQTKPEAESETDEDSAPEAGAETDEDSAPEAGAETDEDSEPEAGAETDEDSAPEAEPETDEDSAPDAQAQAGEAPDAQPAKTTGLGKYKQKYDDYSWLYDNEAQADTSEFELSFKDPKEKEELKSLIDEVID